MEDGEDRDDDGFVCAANNHIADILHHPFLKAYREYVKGLLEGDLAQYHLTNFVNVTEAHMDIYDFWMGGFVEWDQVPWKRSSLEFIKVQPSRTFTVLFDMRLLLQTLNASLFRYSIPT